VENGWSVAAEPGDADVIKEAAARYLRAVGESGERDDRPGRLRGAASLLGRALIGDVVSYAAVEGARVAAPVERDMLLEDWVSALAPLVEQGDHLYGDWAHRVPLEVVEQLEGLTGLAEFARRGGRRAGRNVLAWFDAARRLGAARVAAWDSLPCLDRLLRVVQAARRAVEEATITELAKRRTHRRPQRGRASRGTCRRVRDGLRAPHRQLISRFTAARVSTPAYRMP